MLKSEAEQMIQRITEETGAQFSDEQITALAQVIIKIAGRMLEEALAAYNASKQDSKPQFYQ